MSTTKRGPRSTARIEQHNGRPTLFIDGEPHSALAYMTFSMQERYLRAFADAGVDLFTFTTNADYDYYRFSADTWRAPDEFDYRQFDEHMEMILRASPKARIFPRIYLCSPKWWDEANPGELMAGRDGPYAPELDFGWLPAVVSEQSLGASKATVPSFSSRVWLRDACAALKRFIEHSEERYGHCTIGYHLCSGGSQEWYYWGAFEDSFTDVSEPQQRAFRNWLAESGYPDAESASIPSVEAKTASEFGIFRDPEDPSARLATLYWRFHAAALVNAMSALAETTRDVIGPDKLIGVFYGYFVDLCRHSTCWHNSGHLALQSVLENPEIDFISSPTSYRDRRAGHGFSIFNSATESVAQHGKLWWDENDVLTHIAPELKDSLFHHPQTALESRHLQRREFANALCHGAGMWWFDMWGGYHDDAPSMRDIARMASIGKHALRFDRSSAAEVAVVVDDESIFHTECSNRLTVPLIADQLMELGHAGTPFAVIHVDDLADARAFGCYLFLDLFYVTDSRIRMVRDAIEGRGATSIFVYAPALVGESISIARMERLTGLPLKSRDEAAALRTKVRPGSGIPELEYGTDSLISPVIYADVPDEEILGDMPDLGLPGLVRRRTENDTVVHSAAPCIPSVVLRQLFKDAGVHIYAEGGESVYANASFIALCATAGSRPTLRPGCDTLYDLFEDEETRLESESITLPPSEDGTWVFFKGGREEWQGA